MLIHDICCLPLVPLAVSRDFIAQKCVKIRMLCPNHTARLTWIPRSVEKLCCISERNFAVNRKEVETWLLARLMVLHAVVFCFMFVDLQSNANIHTWSWVSGLRTSSLLHASAHGGDMAWVQTLQHESRFLPGCMFTKLSPSHCSHDISSSLFDHFNECHPPHHASQLKTRCLISDDQA